MAGEIVDDMGCVLSLRCCRGSSLWIPSSWLALDRCKCSGVLFPVTFPSEVDRPRLLPLWGLSVVEDNADGFVHIGFVVLPLSPLLTGGRAPSDMKNFILDLLSESTESIDLLIVSITIVVSVHSVDGIADQLFNEGLLLPVPLENLGALLIKHGLDLRVFSGFSVSIVLQAVFRDFKEETNGGNDIGLSKGVVELRDEEREAFHRNLENVC